jgi:chemotaxis protein MotB
VARKKKHPAHENHERWLVSYADFITLLFAFFVVMFAVSQVDSNKVGRFVDSVQIAFDWGVFADHGRQFGPEAGRRGEGNRFALVPRYGAAVGERVRFPVSPIPTQRAAAIADRIARMAELRAHLEKALSDEIGAGHVGLVESDRGLVIRLADASFFAVGSASLEGPARERLRPVGGQVAELPNPVRIEGHTDPLPIRTSIFPSNWELSGARAAAVLQFLVTEARIARERLSIAGYADLHPVAANDTAEGRDRNRRVDLVVLDAEVARAEEPGEPAAAPAAAPAPGEPVPATAEPAVRPAVVHAEPHAPSSL